MFSIDDIVLSRGISSGANEIVKNYIYIYMDGLMDR